MIIIHTLSNSAYLNSKILPRDEFKTKMCSTKADSSLPLRKILKHVSRFVMLLNNERMAIY